MLKKRYLFLIIIVCLFAVSAVNAQEMTNETNDYDSGLIAESPNEIIAFENTNDSSQEDLLSYGESIYAPDVVKYYGGSERFSVRLSDSSGYGISNADVKITINGNTYTRTTDYYGYASIALGLNSGIYDVTTQYGSKKAYSTVTIKDTVISSDFTKMYKSPTQYKATLVDSDGNKLPYYSPVKININGVFYTRYTDSEGVVVMNINLNPGTYDLTATNPSTGEMHTTKVKVRSTIINNKDLTKYYKSDSQYSIKLLDDNGNTVGSGVGVTFNINGVFYTRYSDENGIVKMNINLNPGEYIITADYKGLKASNNIKVLPTISAKDLTLDYKDGSKFEAKVLNGNGQPYANQQVTFNVNGVFYQRTTDSSGIARLTINLEPGTYTITSTYNGLNAANTIIVNSNSDDDSYLYIDLPSYDTKITRYIGKYTISVEQWRSPSLGEVDIIVTDSNGNIVDKYLVESKISDGSAWSDTYSGYQKAMYHKWQFSPDVRITRIAVKLIGMDWYSGSSNSNTNNGGNSNSEDSGYVYIDLPSYDTKITRKVGIYTIEVEQWRGASIGEVDIMVSEPNGNFVSKYVVESKISDGSSWSDTYSSYERAMYHKWHMDKDVRITRVAVQLLGRHWDGS